ncbi:MAG: tetratricopeptide repeat protein [Saccharothrix sp.]|nr:tetratricopeptide repeat protein [Saccharothrix sp.]
MPARNPNFTGRAELLAHLDEALRSSSTVSVHSLRGMGGVGKSQLAVEYAHRFAAAFDVVWWIPAEQPALIPDHFAALGAALGTPDATDVTVMTMLNGRGRWLLVFDNADEPAAVRPFLPSGDGRVLITTRRAGFGALGAVIDIDVLDRAESVELLRRRVPAVTERLADELSELVGDLPLAIEQASAYLDATGLPVREYLDLLRTRTAEMIGRGRVADRQETLATLWDLSLTAVGARVPVAVDLLDLLAWLAPEPVPLDLFTTHPEALPPSLSGAVTDPVAWADAVGVLVDWFLVRRTERELTIAHRLLQQSLRLRQGGTPARHDSEHPQSVCQALLEAALPRKDDSVPEAWPQWQILLPHVLEVCRDRPAAAAGARLLDDAATYLLEHGQPSEARPLFERALAVTEAAHGPEHPDLAGVLIRLGQTVHNLGDPEAALPLARRALAIAESACGPDDPRVAEALNYLAYVLHALGRLGDAGPLYPAVFVLTQVACGPYPDIATQLVALANDLNSRERHAEALPLVKLALAITEAARGPDHPSSRELLRRLAFTLPVG